MSELKETSLLSHPSMHYLGGFFDETLVFQIEPYPKPSKTTPDNIVYQPKVNISSTNRTKLEFIQQCLPVQINSNIHPDRTELREGDHERWKLAIGNALGCYEFLKWSSPYLEFTKKPANTFMDFLLQKREVRRETQGLPRVPRLYATPEDRMEVEEDFKIRLNAAKSKPVDTLHLPTPERLAGIYDASGQKPTVYTRTPENEYVAHAAITTTHRSLLETLYRIYGGSEPVLYGENITKHIGPSYLWQLNGYEVGRFFETLYPYLVFHKEATQQVLDFLYLKRSLYTGKNVYNSIKQAQRSRILRAHLPN